MDRVRSVTSEQPLDRVALMPQRRPSLLAAPPMAEGRLWLYGGPVFDGRSVSDASAVLVTDGPDRAAGLGGRAGPRGRRRRSISPAAR